MSCQTQIHIDIQGHRGWRGKYPENSMIGFQKAMELGVTTLELDIGVTKDREIIISHEPFMSRKICLNPHGEEIPEEMDMVYNLFQMSHDSIKQFDCGTKFHPDFPKQEKVDVYKPLLSELMTFILKENASVKLNVEIKSKQGYYGIYTPHPKDYVALVLEEIESYNFQNRVTLQSFDINILEEINKQAPKLQIALLVDDNEKIQAKLKALSFLPSIISPYYELLTASNVTSLQSSGFKVIPWTVNSDEAIQIMIDFQVDGIISDHPEKVFQAIRE
ncbi:glycerophosphodiester phosphodiesterase family protein [Winogradskyella maritima]|uniref:Glycerophosphodiester phosphodiesterase family protein n=1 Tax=Winogradskyella maritima TaxID=1517766 RepID=A0ABV8AH80_9FLAO|nr:glycerophosphodiester phosphodiesterase family protein [Winogradskyella maritima]